jgi:hypothetical protein
MKPRFPCNGSQQREEHYFVARAQDAQNLQQAEIHSIASETGFPSRKVRHPLHGPFRSGAICSIVATGVAAIAR